LTPETEHERGDADDPNAHDDGRMMNPMTAAPMMSMPDVAMMGCHMKCTLTPIGMTCQMMPSTAR
jgi:hypothetical protein